jgi:hypothetical protein
MSGSRTVFERAHLEALLERERALFRERTPRSRALAEQARAAQIFGVPMPWMATSTVTSTSTSPSATPARCRGTRRSRPCARSPGASASSAA